MNNYKTLSIKYLLNQKKQSLLTISSIVLSITLITSLLTGFLTFNNMQKENAINTSGLYHTKILDLTSDESNSLKTNDKVSNVGNETFIDKVQLSDKTFLDVFAYDSNLLTMKEKTLESGRMPINSNEIALEHWVLNLINKNLQLNDTVTLDIAGVKKNFTFVGLIRTNSSSPLYDRTGTAIINDSNIKDFTHLDNPNYNSYILIKDDLKIQKSIENVIANSNLSSKTLEHNNKLLNILFENKDSDTFMTLVAIIFICLLIIFASIAVIHNAFSISVLERIKEFGALRSIGCTKKQIKRMLKYEALLLGLVAIPIGLCIGLLIMKILVVIINHTYSGNISLIIKPYVLLFISLLGLVSVLISSRSPLSIASKLSPMEAMNNSSTTIKENINRKHGFLYNRSSIIGKISLKNMKRNKKRFRSTVFSISLSIILFISFYSIINYSFTMVNLLSNNGDFQSDLRISHESIVGSESKNNSSFVAEEGFTNDFYNKLKNIDGVGNVYKRNFRHVVSFFDFGKLDSEYVNFLKDTKSSPSTFKNKEYFFTTSSGFYGYEDDQLKDCNQYLKNGAIDIDEMNSNNGVLIIQNSLMLNSNNNKIKNINLCNLKVGDEIFLDFDLSSDVDGYTEMINSSEDNNINKFQKVKVVGILNNVPYDKKCPSGGLGLISTSKVYKNLSGRGTSEGLDVKINSKADKNYVSKTVEDICNDTPNSIFEDLNKTNAIQKQYYIKISIFLYGIVAIIALISILNIANTINTNIFLKTKEFATLKSIGITPKQLKKMIVLESASYGILGSIYGCIIGFLISIAAYQLLFSIIKGFFIHGNIMDFSFNFPWLAILISFSTAIIICLLSTISPLKKMLKINIIENLRTN